ncbi:hypothetical protein [Kitasatospora sp. NPDC058218]
MGARLWACRPDLLGAGSAGVAPRRDRFRLPRCPAVRDRPRPAPPEPA